MVQNALKCCNFLIA